MTLERCKRVRLAKLDARAAERPLRVIPADPTLKHFEQLDLVKVPRSSALHWAEFSGDIGQPCRTVSTLCGVVTDDWRPADPYDRSGFCRACNRRFVESQS